MIILRTTPLIREYSNRESFLQPCYLYQDRLQRMPGKYVLGIELLTSQDWRGSCCCGRVQKVICCGNFIGRLE